VTLDHKTSHKSHWYIFVAIANTIVWVKMIGFYFMPKIIRILKVLNLTFF